MKQAVWHGVLWSPPRVMGGGRAQPLHTRTSGGSSHAFHRRRTLQKIWFVFKGRRPNQTCVVVSGGGRLPCRRCHPAGRRARQPPHNSSSPVLSSNSFPARERGGKGTPRFTFPRATHVILINRRPRAIKDGAAEGRKPPPPITGRPGRKSDWDNSHRRRRWRRRQWTTPSGCWINNYTYINI